MPDKEIMVQIRALEDQRAWSALDVFFGALPDEADAHKVYAASLAALAENCRATADLYERAKLKGAKTAHIDPLRTTAHQLDIVVKQLEQPRRAPLGQLQPETTLAEVLATDTSYEKIVADAGLDEAPHRFRPASADGKCVERVLRGTLSEACGRYASHPAHRIVDVPDVRSSLDALIASVATTGVPRMVEVSGMFDAALSEAGMPTSAEVEAYRQREANGTDAFSVALRKYDKTPEGAALGVTDEQRADPAKLDGDVIDDVMAYLSGETNDLPAAPPRALVGAHDQTVEFSGFWDADHPGCAPETCGGSRLDPCSTVLKTHGRRHDGEPEHTSAKEILSTVTTPPVPLLGQPGVGGAGYDPTYKPEGGVPLTFAELLEPIPPALLPVHLSHSQIGALGDCPTRYRASRVYGTGSGAPAGDVIGLPPALHRPAIVEIPQWANIGGTTFHAAVEAIERWATLPGNENMNASHVPAAEALWIEHFDAEIAKVEESSPVPRSRWRAANKGAEHESWWRVNGPKMLERYLAARPDQPTLQFSTGRMDGSALPTVALEWEIEALVPTPYGPLPYEAIIDRVTWDERRGAYVIRDYKTGRMPEDSQQLGEYANALRLAGLVFPNVKIYGTFFNARKGEWTPKVDLDEAWPLDWFVYLVTSGHAQKMALTTGPTPARPSSFCGGCAVRWACPIKGAGAKR